MSTLGDAADVNPVIKFLPHKLHVCGRNGSKGIGTYDTTSTILLVVCIWDPRMHCDI